MWRNRNTALLVAVENGTAALTISRMVPKIIKIELPYDPAMPLWIYT
jgi:hypothetical protein